MLKPLKPKMARDEVVELYSSRYACKDYDPELVVSEENMAALLEVGRLSPSSMGMEPWKFLVVRPGEVIDEILPYGWGIHPTPSHYVFLLGREPKHFASGSEYVSKIHNDVQKRPADTLEKRYEIMQNFFTQDLQLKTDTEMRGWIDRQVYIAMGFMLSAAALMGIDSTPIEGMNYPCVEKVLIKHGLLDPEEYHLVGLITFGYTSRESHRPKTRRESAEVVQFH